MSTAEHARAELNARLNQRQLRTREAIEEAAQAVLEQYHLRALWWVEVGQTEAVYTRQLRPGRRGKNTPVETVREVLYTLTWGRCQQALQREARGDGVFPLLSTDDRLSAKEVLQAYKYQPKLEKRFMQFKSIHRAAPLLFKKIERVEANLFAFFVALMLQALLERELRHALADAALPSLPLYPEQRPATHPTTNKVFRAFEDLSTYQICAGATVVEQYRDELNDTQQTILKLLDISQDQFWAYNEIRKK